MINFQVSAWGSPAWAHIHFVAHSYPTKPEECDHSSGLPIGTTANDFKSFFKYVGKTLPCILCRRSYEQFLSEKPLDFTNKNTLTKSIFDLHNMVNKKIGKPIHTDYDLIYETYEKSRSTCSKKGTGCTKPADKAKKMKCTLTITQLDDTFSKRVFVVILSLVCLFIISRKRKKGVTI